MIRLKYLRMTGSSVIDVEHSGCLSTSSIDDNQEQARAVILSNIRTTTWDIVTQLNRSFHKWRESPFL
jgi:hypothetical protein